MKHGNFRGKVAVFAFKALRLSGKVLIAGA